MRHLALAAALLLGACAAPPGGSAAECSPVDFDPWLLPTEHRVFCDDGTLNFKHCDTIGGTWHDCGDCYLCAVPADD